MMEERFARGQLRQTILAYVRTHGPCTTLDLRASLGIELDRIGNVLTRLRLDGLVENEKEAGERVARWAATDADREKGGRHVVIHCLEWTGHKRDDLLTAFFGAAA